jgi:hypothetical protein
MPALQPGDALAREHDTAHKPQCATSESVLVSHPFAGSPSQSPVPSAHLVAPQMPALQNGVAACFVQSLSHDPQ